MIKACIFDLDGTLLDSMHIWEDVDRKFLANHGKVWDKSCSNDLKNMVFDEGIAYLIKRYELPMTPEEVKNELELLVNEQYEYNIQLKDNAYEFLNLLKNKKIPMCVATSCPKNNAYKALKRLNIIDMFEFILTSDDVGKGKNEPDIYLQCSKKLGFKTNEIIVFEDLLNAIKVAKSVGFKTCGILDVLSVHEKEDMVNYCDLYIENFKELMVDEERKK